MNTDEPHPLLDKNQLRQREIAAQVAALHAPIASTRIAAANRLGDMRAGTDALLAALHDPNEQVRSAAAMALGAFSDDPRLPVIVDDLLSAIDDSSERVCQAAIRSLGLLKARVAGPEIEAFLEDPNARIAGATVLALARLAGQDHKEQADLGKQLSAYLQHESIYVRTQAVRAMALLHYQPVGQTLVQMLQSIRDERQAVQQHPLPDADYPLDFRADANYALQNQLVRAVGELRIGDAVPTLMEIAQKDVGLRGLAVEALIEIGAEIQPELLAGLLHDPSAFLRRRLIALMARFNYTPALPLLRSLLKNESVTTRGAAIAALTQMGDREALPDITWIALNDSNPFLRVQALRSLVDLKSRESLPLLLSLSNDPNFEIRRLIVDRLLEWSPPGETALIPLARYLQAFPGDERAPRIQSLLESRSFDLSCLEADDSSLPSILNSTGSGQEIATGNKAFDLPPEILDDSDTLLSLLQKWQQALQHHKDSTDDQTQDEHTIEALTYLISLLLPGKEKE